MPKMTPSLRLHRPSGRAVVTLDGKDFYVGKFGSPESQEAYHRLLAEWMSGQNKAVSSVGSAHPISLTVVEVLSAFWGHARRHYRLDDGQPSDELGNFKARCDRSASFTGRRSPPTSVRSPSDLSGNG